jgi:hypothetical protein
MKLSKALKLKNKLVKELNDLYNKVHNNNSYEINTPVRYNIHDLLKEIDIRVTELIELKTKIHKANSPIHSDIFELAELKGLAAKYKNIPVLEGRTAGMYGSESMEKTCQLNTVDRDRLVKDLESKIEDIQDKLDQFNVITDI